MTKTGKILRESREKQEISLSEVSGTTNINIKFLQSMEEGDISNLPPWTFTRGFLRTYARYLKLDEDLVISTFDQEVGNPLETSRTDKTATPLFMTGSESVTTEPIDKQEKEKIAKGKYFPFLTNLSVKSGILYLAGIVMLGLLVVSIKTVIDKHGVEGEVPSAQENMTVVERTMAEPEFKKDMKAQETVRTAEADKIETKKKLSLIEDQDVKKPQPEPKSETETVLKNENVNLTPKISSPHEVIIKTLDDVVIDYRIDGGKLEHTQMGPDEVFTIRAKRKFAIDFSDGCVVNLVYKGVDRGAPCKPGKPVKVKFPSPRFSGPHEVTIEALGDVIIDYRIDGGKLEHIQMESDEVFTIRAKRKIAIDFNDGSLIKLVHNGVKRGVPGKSGKPVKVRFP
jgi:cytoskeletal protein RodZ